MGDTRYRGRRAKSEQPRDEHVEVLADHITGGRGAVRGLDWEGGELRPKGPVAADKATIQLVRLRLGLAEVKSSRVSCSCRTRSDATVHGG